MKKQTSKLNSCERTWYVLWQFRCKIRTKSIRLIDVNRPAHSPLNWISSWKHETRTWFNIVHYSWPYLNSVVEISIRYFTVGLSVHVRFTVKHVQCPMPMSIVHVPICILYFNCILLNKSTIFQIIYFVMPTFLSLLFSAEFLFGFVHNFG